MKHTEDEIITIAKKVMEEIDSDYDKSKGAIPIEHSIEEQFEKYKKFNGFEENKHKIFAFWDVFFHFPEDEGWGERNMMWVLIKDETGEPYEFGHRQWKGKIVKNTDGKYQIEDYK